MAYPTEKEDFVIRNDMSPTSHVDVIFKNMSLLEIQMSNLRIDVKFMFTQNNYPMLEELSIGRDDNLTAYDVNVGENEAAINEVNDDFNYSCKLEV